MKRIIQRNSDKHYLISAEQNTWTADRAQATEFKIGPYHKVISELLKSMNANDIIVIDL